MQSKKSKSSLKDKANDKSDKKKIDHDLIRAKAEKAERATLDDHRCVVLGTGNPEICHIIPLSVNDKEKSRVEFRKYLAVAATCIYYKKPELAGDPESIPEDVTPSPPHNARHHNGQAMLSFWRCSRQSFLRSQCLFT